VLRTSPGLASRTLSRNQLILFQGKLTVNSGGAHHPRTTMGPDEKGTTLWRGVVDGRQRRYREAMNMLELASLMKELGCWIRMAKRRSSSARQTGFRAE